MGDGGFLPSELDGKVIAGKLTEMFNPSTKNKAGGETQIGFGNCKRHYPNLLLYAAADHGLTRRERTLRHAAWLLTPQLFDDGVNYPNNLFRKFLRYLTWIEHGPYDLGRGNDRPYVNVDGKTEGPAEAIVRTVKKALDNNQSLTISWEPLKDSDTYNLIIEVSRNSASMTIAIRSSKEKEVPANQETAGNVISDADDILDTD